MTCPKAQKHPRALNVMALSLGDDQPAVHGDVFRCNDRHEGLGLRVEGLGFRVWGLGFRVGG